jgi:hypothetical protein
MKDILQKSKVTLQILAALAAVATLVQFIINIIGLNQLVNSYVFSISVVVLLIASLVLLIIQQKQNNRIERYSEVFTHIHNAMHCLRDAYFADLNSQGKDIHIRNSLIEMASAFTLITGHKCRACIKLLAIRDGKLDKSNTINNLVVYNYKRNSGAVKSNDIYFVKDSSDFKELLKDPDHSVFFKNVLPYKGYVNSSYTDEQIKNEEMAYFSTIVWPIRKVLDEDAEDVTPMMEDQDIIGFFCIDSLEKNIYNREKDVEIGHAYADVLYTILKPLF